MITHFRSWDSPRYAICGEPVRVDEIALEPTCPQCQQILAEDARLLAQLEADIERENQRLDEAYRQRQQQALDTYFEHAATIARTQVRR